MQGVMEQGRNVLNIYTTQTREARGEFQVLDLHIKQTLSGFVLLIGTLIITPC